MSNIKKRSIADTYGMVNVIIAGICIFSLLINSIFVDESALNQISDNRYIAYLLNFLAGCEGKLGEIGSMSYTSVFVEGQWWRLFTHIYLHAGILHMTFNLAALFFAGKVVEKKIGSLRYAVLFHLFAIVDTIVVCLIFPDSTSVGASAGIFGMIGVVCVLKLKKYSDCKALLKKGEWVYIIIFSLLSLVLGWESFVTHFIALAIGMLAGLTIQKFTENRRKNV